MVGISYFSYGNGFFNKLFLDYVNFINFMVSYEVGVTSEGLLYE